MYIAIEEKHSWFINLASQLISDMILNVKGSSPLYGYLTVLRCIFGNDTCPFQVVLWTLFLVFFNEFISKFMAFKLHFFIICLCCILCIYISEIFVLMLTWMQLSNKVVFSAPSFEAITIWLCWPPVYLLTINWLYQHLMTDFLLVVGTFGWWL